MKSHSRIDNRVVSPGQSITKCIWTTVLAISLALTIPPHLAAQGNALQVRVELQADCFAGVWANKAQEMKNIVEPGDIDDALRAASAIGDDRIQRQTQGYVVPDSFTHGSSEQRVRWFKRGYQSGDLNQCDTFNTRDL